MPVASARLDQNQKAVASQPGPEGPWPTGARWRVLAGVKTAVERTTTMAEAKLQARFPGPALGSGVLKAVVFRALWFVRPKLILLPGTSRVPSSRRRRLCWKLFWLLFQ